MKMRQCTNFFKKKGGTETKFRKYIYSLKLLYCQYSNHEKNHKYNLGINHDYHIFCIHLSEEKQVSFM